MSDKTSGPKVLPVKDVWDFIHKVGEKIFAMEFVKADGTIRKMMGHFGVQKNLKGGTFSGENIPTLKSVFDMQADGYRSFHVDKVLFMKCGDLQIGERSPT